MVRSALVRRQTGFSDLQFEGLALHMVLRGKGEVRVGDHAHPLSPDGYLLVQAREKQTLSLQDADYLRILIAPDLVDGHRFAQALTPHDYRVNVAISEAVLYPNADNGSALVEALVAAKTSTRDQFFLNEDLPLEVVRGRELLLANLSTGLDLEALAAQVGYSSFHYQRRFSRFHGMSPAHYAVQERVRKACRELILGEDSFGQIAEHCGYLSATSFAGIFKRWTRHTPRQFRAQGRQWRGNLALFR